MELVKFLIPFWGADPYRVESFKFLQQYITEHFPEVDTWTGPSFSDCQTRSSARNYLASLSGGEVLVFIDADSIPEPFALESSITTVLNNKEWMFPYDTYYNLTKEGSRDFMDRAGEFWYPRDEYVEFVFPGPDPHDQPASVGGCVVVHRDAWNTVKGYDERFKGWGGEDRAFAMALDTLVGASHRFPAPIYHLWHPAPEAARFGSHDWGRNKELMNRYHDADGWANRMLALVNEH